MTEVANNRRQFLKRARGTFAAGVGLAVVPSIASRAATPHAQWDDPKYDNAPPPRRGIKLQPDVCGIVCDPISCTDHMGCGPNGWKFQCYGCGYNFTHCYQRSCAHFCECNGCC